jgi:acetaldehyde dehydrogenase
VVPTVDLDIADGRLTLHLVSSAAQVAAPFAHALKEEAGVEYVEVVSTIAAATAGWGTRSNIDELTEGTALAVGAVAGAAEARALIFLGSGRADRPMSNTVFARLADPEAGDVVAAVEATAARLAGEIRGLHLSQFERDAALVTLRIDVGAEGEGGVPNSLEPLIATALMTAEVVASKVVEV